MCEVGPFPCDYCMHARSSVAEIDCTCIILVHVTGVCGLESYSFMLMHCVGFLCSYRVSDS